MSIFVDSPIEVDIVGSEAGEIRVLVESTCGAYKRSQNPLQNWGRPQMTPPLRGIRDSVTVFTETSSNLSDSTAPRPPFVSRQAVAATRPVSPAAPKRQMRKIRWVRRGTMPVNFRRPVVAARQMQGAPGPETGTCVRSPSATSRSPTAKRSAWSEKLP